MNKELFYLPAYKLKEKLIKKEFSCVELISAFLKRAHQLNESFPTWAHLRDEHALKEAKDVDKKIAQNKTEQPFLGVPVAVSDMLKVEGSPTARGSFKLKHTVSDHDNYEIQRIRFSGGIPIGKTIVSEFYLNPYMENSLGFDCCHYLGKELSPGGPEGGMGLAIALGQSPIGLAASSTPLTAALCGFYTFKPTRGLIPLIRDYPLPLYASTAYTPSCCARDLYDLGNTLDILAPKGDESRPRKDCFINCKTNRNIKDLTISWSPNFNFIPIEDDVLNYCNPLIEYLQRECKTLNVLESDINEEILMHFSHLWSVDHYIPIVSLFKENPLECKKLTASTKEWLSTGKKTLGIAYSMATIYLQEMKLKFEAIFKETDLLITPLSPTVKVLKKHPPLYHLDPLCSLWAFSIPTTFSGNPMITFTAGYTEDGHPIGVQIIAKYYNEPLLFQIAEFLEKTYSINFTKTQY